MEWLIILQIVNLINAWLIILLVKIDNEHFAAYVFYVSCLLKVWLVL